MTAAGELPWPDLGPEIDDYAPLELATTHNDPSPKPGTLALRKMLLRYGGKDGGIVGDAAHAAKSSEHNEGRAYDWIIKAGSDEALAVLAWLFAKDQHGNDNAHARRLGVMYLIHDRQMWRSYPRNGLPAGSWHDYMGSNPHTKHMHISLSWAGARGETSFYREGEAGTNWRGLLAACTLVVLAAGLVIASRA